MKNESERVGGRAPSPALLVVAKAPVAGLAKTRLIGGAVRPVDAARLAAASLLDTLAAARAVEAPAHVVALTGELASAERAAEVRGALGRWRVVAQRGADFAERLAAAHADAGRLAGGAGVLQIGMDTPQVTAALLGECGRLLRDADAVLGPAEDGGWWVLGVRDPALARVLVGVPISTAETGARTHAALRAAGARVALAPSLRDVDTLSDAAAVAAAAPTTRFATALRTLQAAATAPA